MRLLPHSIDRDSVPSSLFRHYIGKHGAPETPIYRRVYDSPVFAVGFLASALAVAFITNPSALPWPAHHKPQATVDPSEELLNRITSPNGEVEYLEVSYPTADGSFCVTNPLLTYNAAYLAAIGRTDTADPSTTTVVLLGGASELGRREAKHVHLTWSGELGAFATSQGVKVGAGRMLLPGEEC